MIVAMNHYRVHRGYEDLFERFWNNRSYRMRRVPGFLEFYLLRGATTKTHTLYISYTQWTSRGNFEAWRASTELWTSDHLSVGQQRIPIDTARHDVFEVVQYIK